MHVAHSELLKSNGFGQIDTGEGDMNLAALVCVEKDSLLQTKPLTTGRCYRANTVAILLLWRCPFPWHPFPARIRFWLKMMDCNSP